MHYFITALFCLTPLYSSSVFLNKSTIETINKYQIVDVRKKYSFLQKRVNESIYIDVNALNDKSSIKSSILPKKKVLEKLLQKQGLSDSENILILGEGIYAWGEDGRLFWLLTNYTSSNLFLYDGGYRQFIKDFPKEISKKKYKKPHGNIKLLKDWKAISYKQIDNYGGIKIDVRSTQEYLGATPFGSIKGGRIKEAISIPWSNFFTPLGLVKKSQKNKILKLLDKKKLAPIVYCTAGYRSALIYAVLKEWGVDSLNYDGSWFEYSLKK
ncbi:MAG: hypothetical protein COB02_09560 [Candidatus Cloacimonadota bacterium]|nr:MAG: hypothetical protein COB02_09560 [Candidatus Cloacimonadota bacterium]